MRTILSHILLAIHTLLLLTPATTQATASSQKPQTSPPTLPLQKSSSAPTPTSTLPPPQAHHNIFSDLLDLANLTSPSNPFHALLNKRCAFPCGYYGQVCCAAAGQCYTNALNQAACNTAVGAVASTGNGYWSYTVSYYTATSTTTETIAQTYSTWIPAAVAATSTVVIPLPTAPAPASPTETESAANCADNEISCGPICCKSGTYCLVSGQCAALSSTLVTVTVGGVLTTMYSAPLRVTSSTLVTVTASINPTTTEGFQPAIATSNVTLTENTSQNGGGLSGGAIAGIVIGVIIAVILLILLCMYLCFRTVWVGIFGGGNRRRDRRRVTEEEWRYRSDGRSDYWYGQSGGGRRPPPGGGRPARPRRDDGGGGLGWLGVGAGLAGLAAALGWQRRQDRKRQQARREYSEKSGSSYTDSRESESTYLRSEEEVDRRVYRNGRLVDESDFRRETREHRGGR